MNHDNEEQALELESLVTGQISLGRPMNGSGVTDDIDEVTLAKRDNTKALER